MYSSGGILYDVDQLSTNEGTANRISFDAVTSRSYHSEVVNVQLMDGSVRSVSGSIDPLVWRAVGTRAVGESLGLDR